MTHLAAAGHLEKHLNQEDQLVFISLLIFQRFLLQERKSYWVRTEQNLQSG